jgi:hypothetical protein
MPESEYASCLRLTQTNSGEFQHKTQNTNSDSQAQRPLTLSEFLTGFSVYKNVMCDAYLGRWAELDAYQRDIIEMATRYGGTLFYENHKIFASRAAAHLQKNNVRVDWSLRDSKLFATIFSGSKVNACGIGGSVVHQTNFCPATDNNFHHGGKMGSRNNFAGPSGHTNYANHNTGSARGTTGTNSRSHGNYGNARAHHDAQGRPRLFFEGTEICNNYNTEAGCRRTICDFSHVCSSCKGPHAAARCARNQGQGAASSNIVTCISHLCLEVRTRPQIMPTESLRPGDLVTLHRRPGTPMSQKPDHLGSRA